VRILYFSPQDCWPLTTGARLRNYHLASQLARRAAVTYFGMRPPGEAATAIPESGNPFEKVISEAKGRSFSPVNVIRGLVGPDPVSVLNFRSRHVAQVLTELLQRGAFDTVQIESVHLRSYVPLIRKWSPASAIVADWHNIESELMWRYSTTAPDFARKFYAQRTARLIERAEDRLIRDCDVHTLASDRERKKLEARVPGRFYTIPNGVDVMSYRSTAAARTGGVNSGEILFVGSMDYHANIDAALWFAREVWPRLEARVPDLRFIIVGRNPDPRVKALAAARITVTGTVDDVRPYYARALAVVAPLRVGSGTRLKILEAMAAAVPVVSTSLGAEGLEVEDGSNILLTDTPAEMEAALLRVKSEDQFRRSLQESGSRLVAQLYDWNIQGSRLFEVHQNAAAVKNS
jgi:glycosyltransferase involved in cell wall biosynthesis